MYKNPKKPTLWPSFHYPPLQVLGNTTINPSHSPQRTMPVIIPLRVCTLLLCLARSCLTFSTTQAHSKELKEPPYLKTQSTTERSSIPLNKNQLNTIVDTWSARLDDIDPVPSPSAQEEVKTTGFLGLIWSFVSFFALMFIMVLGVAYFFCSGCMPMPPHMFQYFRQTGRIS